MAVASCPAPAVPANSSGSITFSSAFSAGRSWNDWNTKPSSFARSAARPSSSSANRSTPSRCTLPALGVSNPASRPSSVDLPEPEAPTMATASPAMTARSISCKIASWPAPFGTTLDRPAAFTISALILMDGVMLQRLLVTWLMCLPLTAWAGGTILIYGDSLSAAYGLSQDAGWPTLLQARLKQKAIDYTVLNASISGETTSGGAARIAQTLKAHPPKVIIVALGANDGLRGLPLGQMRANLAKIVRASQKAKSRVLLVGMRLPPNYGESYSRPFAQVYVNLAREYKTALAPFLLEGMAEQRELFQSDNMHPTAQAQPIILDNIWTALAPLLK